MGSHSVTCHPTQVNALHLNPELTLVVDYIRRWFTCPQTVTHPGSNHVIATRPGVEPRTSRSQVQRPDRTLPSHLMMVMVMNTVNDCCC